MKALFDFFRKLFGVDSSPEPDPSDPCNAHACINAKNKVNSARGKYNSICNVLRMLKKIADALRKIVSTPV